MKFTFHLENTNMHPAVELKGTSITDFNEKLDVSDAERYLLDCDEIMNEFSKVELYMQIPARAMLNAFLQTLALEDTDGEILVLESPKTYSKKEYIEVFKQFISMFKPSELPGVIPPDIFAVALGLYIVKTKGVFEIGVPVECIHLVVLCKNIPNFENCVQNPDRPDEVENSK